MRRKGSITLAILLILLGAFLLLNELGVTIPGWDTLWPVFPLAVGLTLLGSYFFGEKREPGRVFFGTAATLTALVFFFITLGPMEYEALGSWWPVFVLIGGVAFLAQWAATRFRDWSTLFLGIVALVVGGAGLDREILDQAAELQVQGILVGGLSPDLIPDVERMPFPVIATEGMGTAPMSEPRAKAIP